MMKLNNDGNKYYKRKIYHHGLCIKLRQWRRVGYKLLDGCLPTQPLTKQELADYLLTNFILKDSKIYMYKYLIINYNTQHIYNLIKSNDPITSSNRQKGLEFLFSYIGEERTKGYLFPVLSKEVKLMDIYNKKEKMVDIFSSSVRYKKKKTEVHKSTFLEVWFEGFRQLGLLKENINNEDTQNTVNEGTEKATNDKG